MDYKNDKIPSPNGNRAQDLLILMQDFLSKNANHYTNRSVIMIKRQVLH